MSRQTLLLNTDGRPIKAIHWQRAIILIFMQKAVSLADYDRVISSPSIKVKVPAVIILKRYAPIKKKEIKFSLKSLLARDDYTCQYCGYAVTSSTATKDHVIPKEHFKSGRAKVSYQSTSWKNIVLACQPCNYRKKNRTPSEAHMKLLKEPVIPASLEFVHIDPPSQWKAFLGV